MKKQLKIIITAMLTTLLILPQLAIAEIMAHVRAEPGVNPFMVEDVQKITDVFNQILKDEMKLNFKRDVRIIMAPTAESYATVLARDLELPSDLADRSSKVGSGYSRGDKIALNCSTIAMRSPEKRAALIGHELFHQVHRQLMGAYYERIKPWFREGTCDLIGALIAERLSYQSVENWQNTLISGIRYNTHMASPNEVINADLSNWITLMEKKKQPYQVASLMILSLFSLSKRNVYLAIIDYFNRVGSGADNEGAFAQAFDIEVDAYLQAYNIWYAKVTS